MNNQTGFTLIEAMMVMVILSIVMGLIPLVFQGFAAIDRTIAVEEDYEWNLFLIQLRDELRDHDRLLIYKNRIFIEKHNQSILYESYGDVLRRRVNNLGHEIVLQKINTIRFSENGQVLFLNVDFLSGTKEEAQFFIMGVK
ncbi:competence type IV pilus minor pilin ComGF [Lederbergia citrea]|uniref:competence type IV pilus minor pilin ComGF n=1 Tax=Lederbergia citrea TaxID=2833581 RepID=UPI001BC983DC|nr:competence type IV pilus minor pilin ComGF [Lederbergia citrea]MBS4176355.1 prepilin-type N-terminal cleavage/methylation domain-containing protein [Lederbergia citrea]MBS4202916.1 prepilin-type N-terminal cleavage/methylation domain-containing protein [Lederbergia citrea]